MADSTLNAIRIKVRRLTRSPSKQQITDNQIDEYINTFVLYDFPEELRLFSLRRVFSFFTNPNVDLYETNAINGDPFFNFKNIYTTIHPPVYVDGYEIMLCQSRDQFFSYYPFTSSIRQIGTGDNATLAFAGTLSEIPVLRNEVLFSSIDATNIGLRLVDDGDGNLSGDGNGTINYVTGAYTLNFTTPPGDNIPIESHVVPYKASRPQSVLYFNNSIKLRPVPDKVYKVEMEAYMRPTELLSSGDEPDLEQWWQYIAYGASKKIFEDRTDIESVQNILPEYIRQETLVLRRTIVQQSNERAATIYDNQTEGYGNRNGNGYMGGFW